MELVKLTPLASSSYVVPTIVPAAKISLMWSTTAVPVSSAKSAKVLNAIELAMAGISRKGAKQGGLEIVSES